MSSLFAFAIAPLLSAGDPLQTLIGPNDLSWFGHAVDFAGDVDGDGTADFIVGAPRAKDETGAIPGRAFVYSGIDRSLIWTFSGSGLERLGWSVSGASDLDGDGHADLLVGATQEPLGGNTGGYACAYSGKSGGVLFHFGGLTSDDQFGYAVDAAGDVNADGFTDLIVGARDGQVLGLSKAGYARVFSGLDGSLLHHEPGAAKDQWLGWSVSAAGDVDGDGHADVLIGIPGSDTPVFSKAGRARIVSVHSGLPIWEFEGHSSNDVFGVAVAGDLDVDGDGVPDAVVGAYNDNSSGVQTGAARAYSGATGALIHAWFGDAPFDGFGRTLAAVGDVDGDGVDDVIVGAPDNDSFGSTSGLARVFSGLTGAPIVTFSGAEVDDRIGSAMAGGRDLNGDNRPDFLIGGRQTLNLPGFVEVRSIECGVFDVHGSGCTGTGGVTPTLIASGCAVFQGPIRLDIAGALGTDGTGTTNVGLLLLGSGSATVPVGGGCSLHLSSLVGPPIFLPLPGDGAGGGAGSIIGTVPVGIPTPSVFHVQAFCADPGAVLGFSTTGGARIEIQ